ncbi:MAG: hypothetical protein ACLSVX_12380 [Massilimicrobiota timonensis]
MSTQQIVLDVSKVKPQALKMFYAHLLRQCELARQDEKLYQEYLKHKERENNE